MFKHKRWLAFLACILLLFVTVSATALAAGEAGKVTTAITGTWDSAKNEIKQVVDKVVFPVLDLVLAVLFFVKLCSAYFDYKKHGDFQWAPPAILFACLLFALTAPQYVWQIIGM